MKHNVNWQTENCLEKFKLWLDAFVCGYMPQILALSSSLEILKFSFHNFFKTRVLLKIFDAEFPYKLSYFEPLCLLAKMAAKTVKSLLLWLKWPMHAQNRMCEVKNFHLRGVIVALQKERHLTKYLLISNDRSLREYQASVLAHWPRYRTVNTARPGADSGVVRVVRVVWVVRVVRSNPLK